MNHYKTVLVDYEGLQGSLDTHGEQGWKLVSANPDTWRKVGNGGGVSEILGSTPSGRPAEEYCASYYLLIFTREDDPPFERASQSAVEEIDLPNYKLPDY